MTCLITGCVAFNGHQYVGGDLHQIGDCYVFNACTGFEASWHETSPPHHADKVIYFSQATDYWERNATLIAPMDQVRLNDAAREYISK